MTAVPKIIPVRDRAWQPIENIPVGRIVQVKTVKGIVCLARVRGRIRWIRRADCQVPYRRVNCVRHCKNSDVVAIAWREP